jgi:hypothetical protein
MEGKITKKEARKGYGFISLWIEKILVSPPESGGVFIRLLAHQGAGLSAGGCTDEGVVNFREGSV